MLCRQHGYPWPSLATLPYCSLLLVGPQGYIPYPHTATVCRFELVVLILLSHMRGPWRTSLMSSSLLLQQCPACLVCLTLIVFVMGGRWPYRWGFVGCYLQDLLKAFLCSCRQAFSPSVSVHVVHSHSSIDTTAAWKRYTSYHNCKKNKPWNNYTKKKKKKINLWWLFKAKSCLHRWFLSE